MCGIFGIADFRSAASSDSHRASLSTMVEAMGRVLAHRGPDDSGAFLQGGPRALVGLGFRRLSIIDVSGGRQPMTNEDGSVVGFPLNPWSGGTNSCIQQA